MIVRDGDNAYAFVHNPRTSGTSITEYLINYCGGRILSNLAHYARQHSVYAEEVKYRKFPNHFIFGFIRNPFSREYSLYNLYCKQKNTSLDFKSWCFSSDIHHYRKPQYGYFCDIDGNLKANVFRFETREQDIRTISEQIGANPDKFASHYSTRSSVFNVDMSYTKLYDNELIDYISDQYAVDIQAFGYYFDGFNDSIQSVPFQFTGDTIHYSQPPLPIGVVNV